MHGLIKAFEALPTPVRSASTNLDQLRTRSDALLAKVESLNRQLQQERAQADQIRLLLDQVAKIELRQGVHTAECGRLEDAYQTLRNLQDSQSLSSALDTFLASNLEAIQDIFSRIHCPRELKVSDLANCTLERSGTQQGVSLTEISTGQRAAFVLSVFLMLNLSLRDGPPVILIDDPIAHVDDLNSLLFLDFLADIAERGNRQIFFATASEKLANLFEKKLAFLGDEFSVLSMPRMQMH